MKSLKHQSGNGAILVIALAALLSLGSTVYYKTRMSQPESIRETYESSADELRQISSALIRYYRDNMSWPANLNELSAAGYFNGDVGRCGGAGSFQSPLCTVIFGGQVGDDYTLTVNLLKETIAQAVANQIAGGSAAGTTVTATIIRPFQSSLYDDYLQRVEDPERAERTQLEVDLDINKNDLDNIGSLNVARATIGNAIITNADINRMNTEQLDLGANSLTHEGVQLNINAGTVSVNGTLSINGEVVGNGNNLTGFNTISADTASFTDLTATNGIITTLSGNTLAYDSGSIDTLSGHSLSYANGTIPSIDGNNLDYNSGSIDTLIGNSLSFSAGNIEGLVGNDLSFGSGNVNVLNGKAVTYTNVNGTNGSFNRLSANNGTISHMNVTGSSATLASGNIVSVSGNSAFVSLVSDSIDTTSFRGNAVTASGGSASSNAFVGAISATDLNVSNRLETNVIEANSSSLGNASASSFSISGQLTATGINTTTASFDNATIESVNGSSANYNAISASQFNGGSYTSNDDFYTVISSVNKNYLLIDEQKHKLDHCVDVTKFCLPETPSVSLSCPTCNSFAERTSFSGVATASISGCRQGCSYQWVTSGSDLNFSGCTEGTIEQGGSASPSCRVSTTLGPQESASGSIKIVVTNSHYTNETASDSVSESYLNTTPIFVLSNVVAVACGNVFNGGSGNYSGCTKTQDGGGSVSLSAFPTIESATDNHWSMTHCPTCFWSYRVISASCSNGSKASVSSNSSRKLGNGVLFTGSVSLSSPCSATIEITIEGLKQIAVYNISISLRGDTR